LENGMLASTKRDTLKEKCHEGDKKITKWGGDSGAMEKWSDVFERGSESWRRRKKGVYLRSTRPRAHGCRCSGGKGKKGKKAWFSKRKRRIPAFRGGNVWGEVATSGP